MIYNISENLIYIFYIFLHNVKTKGSDTSFKSSKHRRCFKYSVSISVMPYLDFNSFRKNCYMKINVMNFCFLLGLIVFCDKIVNALLDVFESVVTTLFDIFDQMQYHYSSSVCLFVCFFHCKWYQVLSKILGGWNSWFFTHWRFKKIEIFKFSLVCL